MRLQRHQVDDVDDADFQVREMLRSRSTAASVSSVGTSPPQAITTSGSPPRSLLAHSQMPMPAVQCLTACVHVQPLRRRLLAGDDHVDAVAAAQAMVGDGQQRIGVGRQIDAARCRPSCSRHGR